MNTQKEISTDIVVCFREIDSIGHVNNAVFLTNAVLIDSSPIGVILDIYRLGGIIMEMKKLSVPNISCGHCVMTIQRELKEVEGVKKVEGDPTTKEITVEWENPATLGKIRSILEEINYPAAD